MTMWDFMLEHPVYFWVFAIIVMAFVSNIVDKFTDREDWE